MLLAAANSIATSLGRHRGAALIGRPLDISVQAVLDAQDDVSGLCLDADVFYADNKLDKSRVRVTAEKGASGPQDAVIRIRSTSLIDEPVVTIYLRVGCQQKTERRYVLLADLVSEGISDRSVTTPVSPPMQVSPLLVTRPAAISPPVNLPAAKPARKSRTPDDAANVTLSTEIVNADMLGGSKRGTGQKKERTAAALVTAKASPTNRPRLKLEPLDLSIDRDPQLKSSAQLLSSPASSPQERSAAAALWRAITAQPQDILRDAEKLQILESSVRSLQAQSQKTQQSINELGVKLHQAESERYANTLVYALALFLLLAIAGVAYLMRGQFLRRRVKGSDKPWWRKTETRESPRSAWADSDASVDILASQQKTSVKKNKPEPLSNAGAAASDRKPNPNSLDVNLSKLNSNFNADSKPPQVSEFRPEFSLSILHGSRAVKVEELFDVQQQADFFVSIGQHEQAIEVLCHHIGNDVETSALVYLDLFNLYHQLERKNDYAALREDFNRRFHTKVPVFEMYTDAGPGLDAYPAAMSRIEALWPSPKVLEVIEESIFRQPETNAEAFNLVAYRELLMLYSVAREIITPDPQKAARRKKFDLPDKLSDSANSRPMSFLPTSIQPLSASIDKGLAAHPDALMKPLLMSTVPPASLNLGLDLDLSEPMAYHDNALPTDKSDAEFFAQFDEHSSAELPAPDNVLRVTKKMQENSDNLIDFDPFELPAGTKEMGKIPKG